MNRERLKITVRGAVQGVGFRPLVYRLATELKLTGWVSNSAQGVFIETEGRAMRSTHFCTCLTKNWRARRQGATDHRGKGDAQKCSRLDAVMRVRPKRLIGIGILVLLVVVAAGAGFDRWRATRQPTKFAPLPQFGSLIPAADDVEVIGKAMCGLCYWGEGGKSCNVVLKTAAAPGVVFLSPNEKVNEIEKITGKCADGKVEIKARGIISQYDGIIISLCAVLKRWRQIEARGVVVDLTACAG